MTRRRAVAAVLITGGVALAAAAPGSRVSAAQNQRVPPPRVIVSERHDRSPALRTMPRLLRPSTPGARDSQSRAAHASLSIRRSRPDLLPIPWCSVSPELLSSPARARSFDGLGNASGVLPPDANGDVGPNHFFQTVNLSLAIYSKGTATTPPALLYGPFVGSTLWHGFGGPCETHNNGDPVVMYDHLADRWFMSQLALPNLLFGIVIGPFYQCIAVSTTPDPDRLLLPVSVRVRQVERLSEVRRLVRCATT